MVDKMPKTLLVWILLWLTVLLAAPGCTKETQTFTTITDQEAADAIQARLLGQTKFNISKVYVARLTIDGNETTITSLVPVFFRGYEPRERGFKLRDGYSFTLLAFNEERSGLELLTRDYRAGEAYHEVVSLASIEGAVTISFPLIAEDGSASQAEFAFRELLAK